MNDALIGERWEIGTTVLKVSEPRIPAGGLDFGSMINCFRAASPRRRDPGLIYESSSRVMWVPEISRETRSS